MDRDLQRRLEALVARLHTVTLPTEPSWTELEDQDDDRLAAQALDRARPAAGRLDALRMLIHRHQVDAGASTVVRALLTDPEEVVVLGAIDLVQPFDAASMERLSELLTHPSTAVRYAAARALGRRKDRSVAARLISWLRSDDPEERRVAIETIIWALDDREGARFLASVWAIPELGPDERLRVASRLAELGDMLVADWLVQILDAGGSQADTARRALMTLVERAGQEG